MKFKAIFLDKDGTIIPDIPYNVNTELIALSEGALEGLQLFQSYGYLLVIITNQSGVALGYFSLDEVEKVKTALNNICALNGIYLDGFYCCPHHADDNCECRKPKPGLLLKAADEMNIDLSGSWMIGDILNDVEAGKKAGCKTVLIENGNETEWIMNDYRFPDHKAGNLADAAKYILMEEYGVE
ncbi:MAG: HAD family hydrolase, partial [Chitinophagaceae bacterium]|nr:HAD family hydrolase [Chitinophagaceae bacterium]